MGGDGGSMPKRSEQVRLKKRRIIAESRDVLTGDAYSVCAMTKEKLHNPVVVDALGSIYNRESVIQFLLTKSDFHYFRHIRTIKDVTSIQDKFFQQHDTKSLGKISFLTCPITNVAANGRHPFFLMTGCGCVLSKKAMVEMGGFSNGTCINCETKWKGGLEEDGSKADHLFQRAFLPLCPPPDERDILIQELLQRKRIAKEAKKAEKRARKRRKEAGQQTAEDLKLEEEEEKRKKKKKRKLNKEETCGPGSMFGKAHQPQAESHKPKLPPAIAAALNEKLDTYKQGKSFRSMFLTKKQIEEAPSLISTKMLSPDGIL